MSCCSWAMTPLQTATEDAGKQASTAQFMFSTTVRNSHVALCVNSLTSCFLSPFSLSFSSQYFSLPQYTTASQPRCRRFVAALMESLRHTVPVWFCSHGLCRNCYEDFVELSGGLHGGSEPPAFQWAEREGIAMEYANKRQDESNVFLMPSLG
ncbi:uncharacterized protein LOC121260169 [Juglans microcarpa x Juglans regia]|uniref:uncharacterized protein LOC121260169 n=1 Tax=Juglans microcarpa x Juglans regia TaxID=2249226 RepID=UPI001B7E2B5A|nr:uncharacterized protein LOC121260169 [Juglans microcarpa x Juglans regia]